SAILIGAMALIVVATVGEAAASAVAAAAYANFPYHTTSTWSVALAVGAPLVRGVVELLIVVTLLGAVFLGRERTDLDEEDA
ncbi:MAG: hypothetical protein JRI25_05990, partial [Deltaproteobacteria bacterium]|nr:hypothetical protein [Deltaproteobacteria bacterium]